MGFIVGDVVARSTVKRGDEVTDFVVVLSGVGDVRDEALAVGKIDKSVAVVGAVGGTKTQRWSCSHSLFVVVQERLLL